MNYRPGRDLYGVRTRVTAVKGQRPGPLDEEAKPGPCPRGKAWARFGYVFTANVHVPSFFRMPHPTRAGATGSFLWWGPCIAGEKHGPQPSPTTT